MDEIRGAGGWDDEDLGSVATLYRDLLEASDIGLGLSIDADAAWDAGHRIRWWDRLRARVNTSPRYLRLTLPAVGVALTLGVTGFLVTEAGSPQRAATPHLAPAPTAPIGGPTKAAAKPELTSAALAVLARPALTAALKPYWTQPLTVTPFDTTPVAGAVLPAVSTGVGNTDPTKPPAIQNAEVTISVIQYADPLSPVAQLYLDPTEPKPTSGTFSDGTRWAISPASLSAVAVRTDGVVIRLQVDPQDLPEGGVSRDNLIHSNYSGVLKAVDAGLPTLPKLPAPAPLTWRTGTDDAAVTALAAAARTAPDPAATDTILYVRTEEKSSSVDDVQEKWLTTDGGLAFQYDHGTYGGKPVSGVNAGNSSDWPLAGRVLLWADVRAFPDSADALQQEVNQLYAEQPHAPKALFDDLAEFLPDSPLSPPQQAAFAAVLSRVPGVVVDPAATTANGKVGVGISLGDKRVIFDPATGRLVETDFLTSTGAVSDSTTVQQVVGASAPRIRPDGTEAPSK